MRSLLISLMLLLCISPGYAQQSISNSSSEFEVLQKPLPLAQKAQLLERRLKSSEGYSLNLVKKTTDQLGMEHEIHQEFYQNIPVEGATLTLHASNGQITHLSGRTFDIRNLSITPQLTEAEALNKALQKINGQKYAWEEKDVTGEYLAKAPKGELVILSDYFTDGTNRLAFKFNIYSLEPLYRAHVYIDAHDGSFITEHALIHETDAPATGNSLYNGNVSFTADQNGGTYRLRQAIQGVETYDLNNGTNYGAATDITSNSSNFTGEETGVQAHYGAEQTYQYFLNSHGRDSYDGNGSVLRSYVSYSSNYVNAFWDGSRMTYGDGDGVDYGPLVSLDIAGHEIAHGVTEFSANLVYQRESGALNESFSDIFGEMVEYYALGTNDWQMGTDIGIGGSGALRSMDNPNTFNDPDTYGGSYWYNPNCGVPQRTNDYCGVHINSGVQNKWFYILALGESGTNDIGSSYSVAGIGREKAAAIAYRNLTTYLSSGSNFNDARAGAIQSAVDLYGAGSTEEIATANAWYAVGVGGEYGTVSYCSSAGSNSSDEWIAGVTIGSFSNTSGGAGYTDFTGLTVQLDAGQSVSVSLTPGFSGRTYNEYWKIWIDYNADGDFADNGELVFDAGGLSASTVSGSINVPASASGTTRMRVSMKYNGSQSACETFSYGEVEDYTVSLGTPEPDTEAPTAPTNLVATGSTQTSIDLSWSASSDNVAVIDYQVYVDNVPNGTTTGTTYTVSNLSPDTSYDIYVTASDEANNVSVNSNTLTASTQAPDTEAPTAPTNLSASNTTQTATDLSWSASSDNVGVAGYQIYVNNVLDGTTSQASYTVSGLTASTSYNIYVIAEDDAGNSSIASNTISVTTLDQPSSTTETVSASFFETGWDDWNDGGSDCARGSTSYAYEGSSCVRIRDNSGTASAMTSDAFDLSSYSQVDLQFYFYTRSMENGEDFFVRYNSGSGWQTIAAYVSGTNFNNNSFYVINLSMSSTNFNFTNNAQFRIQCDASNNNDQVYVDAVTITGTTGSTIVATNTLTELSGMGFASTLTGNLESEMDDEDLKLFPNPSEANLFIQSQYQIKQISIYNVTGQMVWRRDNITSRIDISELSNGMYMLKMLNEEGESFQRKFVKR